jgi:mono/diheme cytochrome c family protein
MTLTRFREKASPGPYPVRTLRLLRVRWTPIVGVLCALIVGTTVRGSAPDAGPISPLRLYQSECLKCHDRDGTGEVRRTVSPKIPDFTDASWQASRSDQALAQSILEGKGKAMRPAKDVLGPIPVQQMVAFIRAFQGGHQIVPDAPEPAPIPARSAPPARAAAPLQTPMVATATQGKRGGPDHGEGARLFQRNCVRCHGADGRGTENREILPTLPDFTNPDWHARRSDPQLVASILEGEGMQMPSFRGRLGPSDAPALVARIRTFCPGRPPSAEAARSEFASRFHQLRRQWEELDQQWSRLAQTEEDRAAPGVPASRVLFQQHCTRCHGADGSGSPARGDLPEIPDFTSASWQAQRADGQLKASILDGKGTGMPPAREKIGSDQARDLVAFIRSFASIAGRPGWGQRKGPALAEPPDTEPSSRQKAIAESFFGPDRLLNCN